MLDIFTWLPTRDLGEVTMKFMIAYTIKPAHFQAAVSRFLETGGTPPDGLRMLGRWHSASKGWSIGDTDDVIALVLQEQGQQAPYPRVIIHNQNRHGRAPRVSTLA